jgi:hypothetical protein
VSKGSDGLVGSCGLLGVTPRREGLEDKADGAGAVFGGLTKVVFVGVTGLGADWAGWAGAVSGGGGAAGADVDMGVSGWRSLSSVEVSL